MNRSIVRPVLLAVLTLVFLVSAAVFADTGSATARTTDYIVRDRSAIVLTWLGPSSFLPCQGERASCDVSRQWVERRLFPDFASGVNDWELTAEEVNAVQIVCQPTIPLYRTSSAGGV